ncbi:MAG TPA: CmcI family methyltransferase [Methyloceanibacter sp.]|nr:CmcI family methyltransferase [Methyloceanibacter sp.]
MSSRATPPPLSSEEDEIVRRFHDLYYRRWLAGADTINLSWFGHQLLKCPFDVWLYQELLVRNRPDIVVETGTWQGGSALFLAMILEQIGHGRVITFDTESRPGRPEHPRITYLTGSSIDPAIVAKVYDEVGGGRAMVILDSDHERDHVYSEILAYSPLVRIGGYLIVEDTNVNGHPAFADYGPGPMEAVAQFLSGTGDFVVDERCERFMMTLNPRGYLRRVAKASASQAASSGTPSAPSAVPGPPPRPNPPRPARKPRRHRIRKCPWSSWSTTFRARLRARSCPSPPPISATSKDTTFLGTLPKPALAHFVRLAMRPLPSMPDMPLGTNFDRELWSLEPPAKPADPSIAALIELAHQEFRANRWSASAAVARLARELAPNEPEPQRLLSMLAPWLPPHNIPPYWLKEPETYYLALGEANRILGEIHKARWFYRRALEAKPDPAAGPYRSCAAAHAGTHLL